MHRYGMSYQQLEEDFAPEEYGELLALAKVKAKLQRAQQGKLPINDEVSNPDTEKIAVRNRMKQSDMTKHYREQAFKEAGI